MEIPKKLKDEIWEYCRNNDITDIDGFMVRLLEDGFNIEKYGEKPTPDLSNKEDRGTKEEPSDAQDNRPDNETEELKKQLVSKESEITKLEQKLVDLEHKIESIGDKEGSDKEEDTNTGGRSKDNLYDDDDDDVEASHGSNVYDDLK